MLKYNGQARFVRSGNLMLIDKIKLDDDKLYFSFPPDLRILCIHIEKFQKVKPFKKFHTLNFSLSQKEFDRYHNNKKFIFKGRDLLSEESHVEIGEEERTFYEKHFNTCLMCNKISLNDATTKSIRKRSHLSVLDQLKLAEYIGAGHVTKSIMEALNISKQTVINYKRKLSDDQ